MDTTTAPDIAAKHARRLDDHALATIFTEARTPRAFLDTPVAPETLTRLVTLAELGPTSANQLPMRIVFVTSPEGKERLRPALAPNNVEKTMRVPVTAIIAHDLRFVEHLPRLYPVADAASWFPDEPARRTSARFNATLQAAYLIIAARALGLDAGPMGGFDAATLDAAFFPDGRYESDLLINLGYGDDAKLAPRFPRLRFDEIATIV